MGFIVIEGLDGAGKSTQVQKLTEYFTQQGNKCKFIHFPQMEQGIFGDLIAKFLRGDLGKINEVHPYLVALIYAGDRNDAAQQMQQWLDNGITVIMDRYVYSNIAFQCAKIKGEAEKEELANWILELEYNYFKIPRPDVNLFLDVPFEFTTKKLTESREGDDRKYLKGKQDIHEANLDFQRSVLEVYNWQIEHYKDFHRINCIGNANEMLTPDEVFAKILETLNFVH